MPPQIPQLGHINREQQGPFQRIGHISAFTASEVPSGGIVHQWLPVEHWGRKLGLGRGLSIDLFSLALIPNL